MKNVFLQIVLENFEHFFREGDQGPKLYNFHSKRKYFIHRKLSAIESQAKIIPV